MRTTRWLADISVAGFFDRKGSDSSGAKSNDLPGGLLSQTANSERPQGVRSEIVDSPHFGLSITSLEWVFSNRRAGDGF